MTLAEATKLLKEQRKAGNVVICDDGTVRLTAKGMREAVAKWRKENSK